MSTPDPPVESRAARLAASLTARVGPLADLAAEVVSGIERDRVALESGRDAADSADELIDAVIERVEEVEADCRRLVEILSRFHSLSGGAPAPAIPAEEPAANGEALEALPAAPSDGPLEAGAEVSEGVRLLATQMSVAGASHEEIAQRLTDDFGVEDAERLVAQLFGRSRAR